MSDISASISDGMSLDKQQRVVEKFMAIINTGDVQEFGKLTNYFATELQDTVSEETFIKMRKEIRETFGILQEMRFASYERFDQGDRLTYISRYTRKPLLRMVYGFDEHCRMTDFSFIPLNPNEAQT